MSDTAIYGKAFRAALAETRKVNDDERVAKDQAHSIGSIAAMVAEGKLRKSDLKKGDEPAMVAALRAVKA